MCKIIEVWIGRRGFIEIWIGIVIIRRYCFSLVCFGFFFYLVDFFIFSIFDVIF